MTGATGRIGGTGRHVAAELRGWGLPVRAMVRRFDERSEALRDIGIEVVIGDFADYTSLLATLNGIEAAYFCYPVGAGLASHVAVAEIILNEWIANTTAAGQPNPTAAAHLSAQSMALRRRSAHLVTNDVQRLTGRPAAILTDFVARNRQAFMPNPDVAN